MRIRELAVEDLDEVFAVRIATWHNANGAEELAGFGITVDSVGRMMADGTHRGWVCEIGSRIVGFAMGDQSNGEMWVIAVLKEHEGKGIGRALIESVESWLASCGWESTWLTTDVDDGLRAVGFYRHLGWADWKFEHGDRYMRKELVKNRSAPCS